MSRLVYPVQSPRPLLPSSRSRPSGEGAASIRAAARAGGVCRATAYRLRRACPRFRELWDAALLIARPQVEEVLADRALNGVQETVYYHGEEVATRTRYDARLLLAHLGRLDKLQQKRTVREATYGFDFAIEALREDDEIEWE